MMDTTRNGNRFKSFDEYLKNQHTSMFLPKGNNSFSITKAEASKCPQYSDAIVGSDEFVLDVLQFFFEERLNRNQLNDRLRQVAADAFWRATEGSDSIDLVPRPPAGKPGPLWLVSQAVQIAFRKAQNKCIYEAVKLAVKAALRSEYEFAKIAVEAQSYVLSFLNLRTSDQGIEFIKQFEFFQPNLYNDPVGYCTIGYGTLVHRGNCNGSEPDEFRAGISEQRADELLKQEIGNIEGVINASVTVPLNQSQFDSIVSFAYNIGPRAFKKSTLLKKLNQGDNDSVLIELKKWVKGGGKTLAGLVRRREAEANMFKNGTYSISSSFYSGLLEETPRGIRNNNPGNIEINRANEWEGRVQLASNTDGRFEQFISYEYGIRALIVLLRNYIKSGRNTITKVFAAYAPPTENNTKEYINFVSGRISIGPNETLPITKQVIKELTQAIGKMENGRECITDEQFEAGWVLIPESVRSSISQSMAVRANRTLVSPLSANERALVVLIENGGIDLRIGNLADSILAMLPGSSSIPDSAHRDLIDYLNRSFREMTDNLLEDAELVVNRYQNAQPAYYSEVVVLRNSTATYDELKNTLIRLTRENKITDLFVLTHGTQDYIAITGGINSNKIRQIKVDNGNQPLHIRSVYMMNCVGSSLNKAWLDIGAKVSSGTIRDNKLPEPSMYFFWKSWMNGLSFNDAVTNSYRETINALKQVIRGAGNTILPFVGGEIADRIADIEKLNFVRDSAPVIQGDGSLTINSDSLTFAQWLNRDMAITVLPVSDLLH